jgi:hypothetical protein
MNGARDDPTRTCHDADVSQATVDDALEARVAEAIAARREVIAELVRQAVDRELDAALERLAALSPIRPNGSRRARPKPGSPLDCD